MTKPSLNEQQLAELDEILNFAKEVQQKIKEQDLRTQPNFQQKMGFSALYSMPRTKRFHFSA